MTVLRARRGDQGFTLVEVMVALTLMALIMAAAAPLFIRSIAASSNLERRQAAVALAGQGMELVRAVSPADGGLVVGRSRSAVDAQWSSARAAALGSRLSDTNRAWQTTAVAPTVQLPFSTTSTVRGQRYTTDTYIGTCTINAGTGNCRASGSGVQMYRVVVAVSWNEGGRGACGGTQGCNYSISTLISGAEDPTFNTNPRP